MQGVRGVLHERQALLLAQYPACSACSLDFINMEAILWDPAESKDVMILHKDPPLGRDVTTKLTRCQGYSCDTSITETS